jgi:hypothetical protein
MSEELNNENVENAAVESAPVQESAPAEQAAPVEEAVAPADASADSATEAPSVTQPQVIVQRERGFAHYVGFALLCVLSICFFFMPGIALTFGVSRLVSLNGAAAWIFSAILSFVIWLIFKLKIKGFKKSFYFYIGLCVVVLAALIAIEVLTENLNVFSSISALLTGAVG